MQKKLEQWAEEQYWKNLKGACRFLTQMKYHMSLFKKNPRDQVLKTAQEKSLVLFI